MCAPRLRSAIPNNAKALGCEDAQELIQDAICMAAKLYDNAEKAGKKVTPGNITYFAIQHARSGRRSYGTFSVEPLHPRCQIKNNAKVAAFEDPVATEGDQRNRS